jgi:hypothetical protein
MDELLTRVTAATIFYPIEPLEHLQVVSPHPQFSQLIPLHPSEQHKQDSAG